MIMIAALFFLSNDLMFAFIIHKFIFSYIQTDTILHIEIYSLFYQAKYLIINRIL